MMLWWDWKTKKRLGLLASMLGLAAIPWLLICSTTNDWRPLLPGAGFLSMPMLLGWALFVGLKTGRMPSAYGKSELRTEAPKWFWLTGSLYAGLVLLFLWIILAVLSDGPIPHF
jgi:hypothetical protein